MITEKDKAARITKEIIHYFLEHHLYTFDLHFNITCDFFELEITTKTDNIPDTFDQFVDDLSVARQYELDEYYNSLLGSHNEHQDYKCLGQSIDKVSASYEDGTLGLYIKRLF
ncbi:hypothetical protein I4Q36_03590 [Tuanshanicoccus lijuaniae]|uniref:hypothetical protein n=1 Tax=Aerococcaceae bacterium zg-1292 TaxID=2774330 RepID=UPI001935CB67|nr:hypothetical protein [Aerococcaceae bacterium zg-1292]MBF6625819.1 hypothetical protein [Aerococcaceae bacterium zg-BR9]MBS4455605.1 hypothetical protein [Aerococcaceae bacterium zg-A91]MBS4457224.1 hypothetical protein [Aerococcaceae bacterium zg-BR33]QQA37785.1 hypothetical protein I4Q36_03590 [Aerococcaceae bacterium zg-1292]